MIRVPKVIDMCEEALRNRPSDPYVFLEFSSDEYHDFIKKVKPEFNTNGSFRGIRGEIVSQQEGKVLVKYNANDLLKNLNITTNEL